MEGDKFRICCLRGGMRGKLLELCTVSLSREMELAKFISKRFWKLEGWLMSDLICFLLNCDAIEDIQNCSNFIMESFLQVKVKLWERAGQRSGLIRRNWNLIHLNAKTITYWGKFLILIVDEGTRNMRPRVLMVHFSLQKSYRSLSLWNL